MATRSKIAIENSDGTVSAIYSHWDGYPSHNGVMLAEHYTNREKVQQLINLGSISSLGKYVFPEGKHDFNKPEDGTTVAYHRDRGESLTIETHSSVEAYLTSDVEEYGYLFTADGEWIWVDGDYTPSDRIKYAKKCSEITVK
jgi:hypothetical protein